HVTGGADQIALARAPRRLQVFRDAEVRDLRLAIRQPKLALFTDAETRIENIRQDADGCVRDRAMTVGAGVGFRAAGVRRRLQENIGRLEVAVDDAARVRVVDGAGEGLHQAGGGARI